MAYAPIKSEGGNGIGHSRSARWMTCGEAKQAAKRKRRQADKRAVKEER